MVLLHRGEPLHAPLLFSPLPKCMYAAAEWKDVIQRVGVAHCRCWQPETTSSSLEMTCPLSFQHRSMIAARLACKIKFLQMSRVRPSVRKLFLGSIFFLLGGATMLSRCPLPYSLFLPRASLYLRLCLWILISSEGV